MCIDLPGMSEVKWPASSRTRMNKSTLYYSGSDDSRNRNSVAVLIRNEIVGLVILFIPYPDRVMLRDGT